MRRCARVLRCLRRCSRWLARAARVVAPVILPGWPAAALQRARRRGRGRAGRGGGRAGAHPPTTDADADQHLYVDPQCDTHGARADRHPHGATHRALDRAAVSLCRAARSRRGMPSARTDYLYLYYPLPLRTYVRRGESPHPAVQRALSTSGRALSPCCSSCGDYRSPTLWISARNPTKSPI